MKRIIHGALTCALIVAVSMSMAVALVAVTVPLASPALAASQNDAWGVTGVNFMGPNDYSEVFKVDPATGAVTIVGAYTGSSTYSDIAMTPNGNLYTVGYDADGVTGTTGNFYDFYRLDPTTAAMIGWWLDVFRADGRQQVNALCAESDTSLLAIEGGGVNNPHLMRINLDGSGDYSSLSDLGALPTGPSGGDLDKDPFTGKWYGAFEGSGQTEIWELNIANPASSTQASAHSVTYLAGLSFRPNGTTTGVSLAGSWNDTWLYEVNVNTSSTTQLWDLSIVHNGGDVITGNIFGLSPIQPESVTTPNTPTGPSGGNVGQSRTFTTGGATSNLGHAVEYRFDWGDGSYSPWSSSTTASHSWSAVNTYTVKAQARCATHTGIISSWSSGTSINITAPTPPAAPSGLTATAVSSSQIDLSWQDNSDNEDGFKIERSDTGAEGSYTEIDTVGAEVETYSDTGLDPNTTYYYRVRAYNAVGDSNYTEDSATTLASEDGKGCFIATAAYGSDLDSHVETLRNFRDSYMVTNPVGSALVSAYYKLSPPVADFIDDHPTLKPIVRAGLMPAVALSTVAVNTSSAEKIAIIGSLALVSVALATWARKRRGKGSRCEQPHR
jgi:hypothetical protein